MQINYCSRMST